MSLPAAARIVIIGGGAIGCSIAMHLAEAGECDVVLIDKSGVTHGSTWHAAGLVGQYRSQEDLARLMQASVAVLNDVARETPVDWRPVGSLRIASSAGRLDELREGAARALRYGVGFCLIDADEAQARFPLLSRDGVVGAAFVEGDGYVDPASLTQAYAARARRRGVRILEEVAVTGFEASPDGGHVVRTGQGAISCRTLVLAPGVWARPLGRMLGLDLPVAAIEHQYAVTARSDEIERDLPALRDPDLNFYLKPDVGAFAIGGWEHDAQPATEGDMPFTFGRELLPDALERLEPILANAARRIPLLEELGLRRIVNGPIPVTPDGEPILGPAPGRPGVYLAVGFTSGIAASGGAGRALAHWILRGNPEFPIPSLDPRRFGTAPILLPDLNRRAVSAYAAYYALSEYRRTGFRPVPLSS
jgi:sarcosine dehydrogenase